MEKKRSGVQTGVLLIFVGIIWLLIGIDASLEQPLLPGGFSGALFHPFHLLLGSFAFMVISLLFLAGFLCLIDYTFVSKLFVFAGYLLLIMLLPVITAAFSFDSLNAGLYGIRSAQIIRAGGLPVLLLVLFLWIVLSIFLLLYPVRNTIVLGLFALINLFLPKKGARVAKSGGGYKKDEKTNIFYDEPTHPAEKKHNHNKTIPWLSRVVYESYDKRVETPLFPSSESPVRKFKLKTVSEETEEFSEVDTLSGTQDEILKKNEEAGLPKMEPEEYYRRVKETWPDSWTGKDEEEQADQTDTESLTVTWPEEEKSGEVLSIYDVIDDDEGDSQVPVNEEEAESLNDEDETAFITEPEIAGSSGEYRSEEEIVDDPSVVLEFEEAATAQDLAAEDDDVLDESQSVFPSHNDSIDRDDIEKFVGNAMNEYADKRPKKEDGAEIDEDDFLDEGDYVGGYEDQRNIMPDKELLEDAAEICDKDEYRRIENEDARILEDTLAEFGIRAEVCDIIHGPVVTLFKLVPAPGIKLSKIESLSDNLALRLAAQSIRIIAPIPGEKVVGIEVPNKKRELVSFKEVVNSEQFTENSYHIPVGIGKDIYGKIIVIDLHKMPHVLIAGATGAGKSVCVNVFLSSILFSRSPDDVRMILIDPKIVELQPYDGIPHLLAPVITDSKSAISALRYLVYEMEERYALLGKIGVRDISEYRKLIKDGKLNFTNMPYIVAFVDEFADLMTTSGKEAELLFARLTAKARAIGIHLILATQRPSTDVITGLIKSNVPARFAFQVISYQDSRIILDQKGAEKLLGQGDMLYLSPVQPFPIRLQGAYLSKEEVDLIAEHWKSVAEPEYVDIAGILGEDEEEDLFSNGERTKDPLFDEAVEIVVQSKKASASYLQRRLNIGYNRAARLVEEMESMGIVGPMQGSKPREILGGYDL